MKTTVIFDMWGQECQTTFDETSELTPLKWIETVFDKGWMYPREVIREDGLVLVTEEQMAKLRSEWLG